MIKALLSRIWPQSLGAQLICTLLLAVLISQIFVVWIFHDERRIALIQVARDNLLMRSISVAKLLEDTPPGLHERVLEASSSRFSEFWLSETPVVSAPGRSRPEIRLQRFMSTSFTPARDVYIRLGDDRRPRAAERRTDNDRPQGNWKNRPGRILGRRVDLAVSIPMADGGYLNVATSYRPPPRAVLPLIIQMGFMGLAIFLIVFLAVRRLSRPLKDLAKAAEDLGRGAPLPPLAVTGPKEVRAVTQAFNDMQDRLTRFVRDRTRMLAAISHDLRTPITSLRLRAEFIEDDENREKIIQTLEEMAAMTEATLAFARDEAKREDGHPTDLAALLSELTADQQALGHDVTFAPSPALIVPCRPVALKRALRNLIENGVRYGQSVEIVLSETGGEVQIAISDRGPGIPEDQLDDVFEPFVRLDESRSEETGGIGMGLAIARSLIHAHGGRIVLENKTGGGLRATVHLPMGR